MLSETKCGLASVVTTCVQEKEGWSKAVQGQASGVDLCSEQLIYVTNESNLKLAE